MGDPDNDGEVNFGPPERIAQISDGLRIFTKVSKEPTAPNVEVVAQVYTTPPEALTTSVVLGGFCIRAGNANTQAGAAV